MAIDRYTIDTIKRGDIPEFDEAKILAEDIGNYARKYSGEAIKALDEIVAKGIQAGTLQTQGALDKARPFAEAAESALKEIQAFTGTGPSALSGEQMQKRLESLPGYQFQMDRAQSALQRSQAAKGGLLSGRAVTQAMDRAQGVASAFYGAHLDRLQGLLGQTSPFVGQQMALQGQLGANLMQTQAQAGNTAGQLTGGLLSQSLGTTGNLYKQAYNIRDEELTAAGLLGIPIGLEGKLGPIYHRAPGGMTSGQAWTDVMRQRQRQMEALKQQQRQDSGDF